MDPEKKLLKTKSQKILSTVQNELKKFSPTGASKRILFTDSQLPKGHPERLAKRMFTHTQGQRQINGPLLNYLNTNHNIADIYTRYSKPPLDKKRLSSSSPHTPNKTPENPSEPVKRVSQVRKTLPPTNPKSLSPRLDAVNDIIEACNSVGSPAEQIIPQVLKGCRREMSRLVTQVDKAIRSESSGNWDEKRIEREIEKDCYVEEEKKETMEMYVVDKMVRRNSFKVREYSMPKHLDNFLKQHTHY